MAQNATFMNLNIQGLNDKAKQYNFCKFLMFYQVLFFTIQETKFKANAGSSFGFLEDLYTVFDAKARTAMRGVAIGFRKNMEFSSFKVIITNERFIAINFSFLSLKCCLVNYYASNVLSFNKIALLSFIGKLNVLDRLILFAGDFNFHEPNLWPFFNRFCLNNNLCNPDRMFNRIPSFTRVAKLSASTIDFIFVNKALLVPFSFSTKANILSDHMALFIKVNFMGLNNNLLHYSKEFFKINNKNIVSDIQFDIDNMGKIYILVNKLIDILDIRVADWLDFKDRFVVLLHLVNRRFIFWREQQLHLYRQIFQSYNQFSNNNETFINIQKKL